MFKSISILLFLLVQCSAIAQELNCNVVINHQQVRSSDDYIYDNLQKSIAEFMNNRKWTSDVYQITERIECSIFITLNSRSGTSFGGSVQVQSSRPVYGTNYKTTMFIVNDNDLEFTYVDQQALDFNLTEFQNNLTSILAFYAYVIIGIDYDSFSKDGGSPYFQKAFDITTLSQNGGGSGWRSSDGSQNRYWLIENINNGAFKFFRDCLYQYHFLGLDIMKDKKNEGTQVIFEAIKNLENVHKRQPASYLLQVFFNGKSSEIVNIFQDAPPAMKNEIVPLLIKIDPGNTKKYNEILKSK